VYDFALPMLMLHALRFKTAESLKHWWVDQTLAMAPPHVLRHLISIMEHDISMRMA